MHAIADLIQLSKSRNQISWQVNSEVRSGSQCCGDTMVFALSNLVVTYLGSLSGTFCSQFTNTSKQHQVPCKCRKHLSSLLSVLQD
jgi:hypothetical protein